VLDVVVANIPPWQYALEVIAEKPDLYLDKIQWHLVSHCELYVSQHTIRRRLNHEKWAEKKAAYRAKLQDPQLCLAWPEIVNKFSAEMLVFCEESGVDRPGSPIRTGWTPKGDVPKKRVDLPKMLRYHLVPALSTSGIVDLMMYKGPTATRGLPHLAFQLPAAEDEPVPRA